MRRWDSWLHKLRGVRPVPAPAVVALRTDDVAAADLAPLRTLIDEIGADWDVPFQLGGSGPWQAALLELDLVARADPTRVRAHAGGLPLVLFDRAAAQGADGWAALRAELERQLRLLPAVRRRVAVAGGARTDDVASSSMLSTLLQEDDAEESPAALAGESPDPGLRDLVGRVLRGLRDDSTPPLRARYADGGALVLDFAAWQARLDPAAERALRLSLELPRVDDAAQPDPHAVTLDLDLFVWHLGLACGRYVLLDQPADGWHVPLASLTVLRVERYSRQPRHLELARRLALAPATPELLRRHVLVGVAELRGFLQACLFLGLVHWVREGDGRA